MVYFFLGLLAVALIALALTGFAKADPRKLASSFRIAGGVAVLAGAGWLTWTGRLSYAIPLIILAFTLYGRGNLFPANLGQRTSRKSGQVSRVRTAFVEMELDLDSGAMRGTVLAGPFEGLSLDQIAVSDLVTALSQVDPESRALLETYLDRRSPGWREDMEPDGDARRGGGDSGVAARGPISAEEAYEILGLQPGAGADEIRRAHRDLMKKLHPDKGGSTYLAARVNEAKDLLLRDHD
jgi:hypothetical protein